MKIYNFLFLSFLLFISLTICAQSNTGQYKPIDEFVIKQGPLTTENVASIAMKLTATINDNEQKARAIFFWISNNIALDVKAIKINDERKSLPEDVIKERKATSLGFAKLFQEMSSLANIRCLVVDGFIKKSIDDLNNPADEINHSWNVVQLGQSPDKWYYVDAALASGTLDKKMSVFTKDFTSEYFFAERSLFNLDHYPDNDAWQLGTGPKSSKEFYGIPLIYNAAFKFECKKPTPANGYIKTKTTTKTTFSIPLSTATVIENVSLIIGDGRKQLKPEPMNFTMKDGSIQFNYQFKTEDTYPVKIAINEKIVFEYMVEVTE